MDSQESISRDQRWRAKLRAPGTFAPLPELDEATQRRLLFEQADEDMLEFYRRTKKEWQEQDNATTSPFGQDDSEAARRQNKKNFTQPEDDDEEPPRRKRRRDLDEEEPTRLPFLDLELVNILEFGPDVTFTSGDPIVGRSVTLDGQTLLGEFYNNSGAPFTMQVNVAGVDLSFGGSTSIIVPVGTTYLNCDNPINVVVGDPGILIITGTPGEWNCLINDYQ